MGKTRLNVRPSNTSFGVFLNNQSPTRRFSLDLNTKLMINAENSMVIVSKEADLFKYSVSGPWIF